MNNGGRFSTILPGRSSGPCRAPRRGPVFISAPDFLAPGGRRRIFRNLPDPAGSDSDEPRAPYAPFGAEVTDALCAFAVLGGVFLWGDIGHDSPYLKSNDAPAAMRPAERQILIS